MRFSQFSLEGFPLWLYYTRQEEQEPGHSPVSFFNPAIALQSNPYVGATSPSAALNKKTLVVTEKTLGKFEEEDARAILYSLHLSRFTLLLWYKNMPLLLRPEDTFELPDESDALIQFSENDYIRLIADYHLTRDHVEILEEETWDDLCFALRINIVIPVSENSNHEHSNIERYRYGVTELSTMVQSLANFFCIPGFFQNNKDEPYYMRQYDPQICDFLLKSREP
jgi:hypothetical protein